MAETGSPPTTHNGLLAGLAAAASQPTGAETFERFLWQAKQAVRLWLDCLSKADGPLFVVCEHVDDITLVYRDRLRFLQLKTRDRGSWSATQMCNRGIDALVRSYNAAREVGIYEAASFELWLEGPISDTVETIEFAKHPSTAAAPLRTKIVRHGLKRKHVDDFLGRLVVCPRQPSRADIDAKALRELGAIWPSMSSPELDQIYERLLTAASAAQAASTTPASVQAHLSAAQGYLDDITDGELPAPGTPLGDAIEPIRNQVLSRATLIKLAPPLPGESAEQLLARIAAGSTASLLELKMTAAGASTATIQAAQAWRADMEVERQLLLASRNTAEVDLEHLAIRVLTIANATATRIALTSASNPAAAARPAEAIAADLLSRPSELGQCDRHLLFGGDGQLVYGYIGHLSDLCRFDWRAA
ncbi:MAG: DUF4297 domain-containing protein [Mycobacterium sp.]|nr:DUF4297 domain-containing protein [Mycobacterium sp.]